MMGPGLKITASDADSSISVRAGSEYDRIYSWAGCEGSVGLYARADRWYGSLGIYYPGSGITWWIPCKGINRAVVEEGQQHFRSVSDALEWVRALPRSFHTAYRGDGLVIQWLQSPGRSQLNVDVWQVCIAGDRPKDLPGADDSRVTVVPGPDGEKRLGCVAISEQLLDRIERARKADRPRIDDSQPPG